MAVCVSAMFASEGDGDKTSSLLFFRSRVWKLRRKRTYLGGDDLCALGQLGLRRDVGRSIGSSIRGGEGGRGDESRGGSDDEGSSSRQD